ncbi:hypothetical protein [Azospirillum argentinense]
MNNTMRAFWHSIVTSRLGWSYIFRVISAILIIASLFSLVFGFLANAIVFLRVVQSNYPVEFFFSGMSRSDLFLIFFAAAVCIFMLNAVVLVLGVWHPHFNISNWGSEKLSPRGFLRLNCTGLHFSSGNNIALCTEQEVMIDLLRGIKNLRDRCSGHPSKILWACTQHHHLAYAINLRQISLTRCSPLIIAQILFCEIAVLAIAAVEFYRNGKLCHLSHPGAFGAPMSDVAFRRRDRREVLASLGGPRSPGEGQE